MWYESHILPRAQRDIKKLQVKDLQGSILQTCLNELEENPRPSGCLQVKGQKGLYRVHSKDGNYRIIYSVLDNLRAVIIVTVRKKKKGAYKDIPTTGLSDKIKQLEKQLQRNVALIRESARGISIDWVSGLSLNHVRYLEIGIRAMHDERVSAQWMAARINEVISVNKDVNSIANDMTRLVREMQSNADFFA